VRSNSAHARRKVEKLLLDHPEPSIRWKTIVHVLGEDPKSRRAKAVQETIRSSPRVQTLLAHRQRDGRLKNGRSVYDKWQGAHWILATLADIGYPRGDESLEPIRDQILDHWLQDSFYQEFEADTKADAYKKEGVPMMQGRHRRCASQQGNALYFLTRLGITDSRADRLVERLLHWQWPDGGWNCDKDPNADTSSFMESLLPMCGLAAFAQEKRHAKVRAAALKASEVFLSRKLFKRRSDSRVIHPEFVQLHYPLYWHYDILAGLKAMAEVDRLRDRRCEDALDLLESKELPDGGWPAEKRYYKVAESIELGADFVDWGGTSKHRMNAWVTVDALRVLREAGRI
jgi:hypothetical protein